ncbi:hypothetical protein NEPAR06_1976 [Nematocida parisii]|uniref:Uncharacterized protein n=1 Tax=Nematocida parisii (strain ERTm3) TaxID=935791 RepID=I3EG27_NEMP3|nr:uncharacterized protein NEPG_01331 [Nematocida parisii ERTm1]EIJ88174.1 hypothetical protein NEQG_01618 [Nematocida parisii ERTm3]KAI5130423.1 hypothetical protein NEPAR03_2068 [Nematocida parisii]EIJ93759.1 hypothetical protein NEPG_01331 [Nematocida parisii ERTm1]KAI5130541.1 hypothetical protein NEPAR08_2081 [Nematocida parisii]KAI5144007.1 hypothetical protein NEPAR04_2034 [Nematocida parisii]|eukprot:XP_013059159.1 hypothetical protein NEPG_01331 [Nematocida parisii ERTm1]
MVKKNIVKLFISVLLLVCLLNFSTSHVKAADGASGGDSGGGTQGTFKDVFTHTFIQTQTTDGFFIKTGKITFNVITSPIWFVYNLASYGFGTISGRGWTF